jgi:hypothetical protein
MTVAPVNFYSFLQTELRIRGQMVASDSQFIHHSPVGRGKKLHLQRATTSLYRKAENAYMDGNWHEATVGFTLATLVCLEVTPPLIAASAVMSRFALEQVLHSLDKTISELTITRSRVMLSLRLAEGLLKMETTSVNRSNQEEAILAYSLLRKLLGSY